MYKEYNSPKDLILHYILDRDKIETHSAESSAVQDIDWPSLVSEQPLGVFIVVDDEM